jgi:hypothetical protein
LILPGVPDIAEKAALAKKVNSYGKTWHIWDTGHLGQPAANKLPIGSPMLAWSYNRDDEAPPDLVAARDQRMHVDTSAKRKQRADLASRAKAQMGTDAVHANPPVKGATAPAVHAK